MGQYKQGISALLLLKLALRKD